MKTPLTPQPTAAPPMYQTNGSASSAPPAFGWTGSPVTANSATAGAVAASPAIMQVRMPPRSRKGAGIMNNPSETPFAKHYDTIRKEAVAALVVNESKCKIK